MSLTVALTLVIIFMSPFALIGLLTFFWWFKPAKEPADTSNRIGNISSWWIGLTRPDVLAKSYKYFQQDIMDNVEDVEKKK